MRIEVTSPLGGIFLGGMLVHHKIPFRFTGMLTVSHAELKHIKEAASWNAHLKKLVRVFKFSWQSAKR